MQNPEPSVGPFYYINNEIYSDQISAADAEKYGDFMTWGSHFDFWDKLCDVHPNFNSLEYNHFPRGRVTYNYHTDMFYIYINPLLNKPHIIGLIASKYVLTGCNYTIDIDDEHYQS